MIIKTDLHNHSCLSPCGSLEMSPRLLARRGADKGIGILALTDHNSTRNTSAFSRCCFDAGIFPVFGAEVTTSEEVHVLCLFDDERTALSFGEFIESLLPEIPNAPDVVGDQVYVDRNEMILGEVEKYLLNASGLSLETLMDEVFSRNGLFIPAHIDRPSFSLVSQLGFLPELPYSAVEALNIPVRTDLHGATVITGSDAHIPEDIGSRSFLAEISEVSFRELGRALLEGSVRLSLS